MGRECQGLRNQVIWRSGDLVIGNKIAEIAVIAVIRKAKASTRREERKRRVFIAVSLG
jgi:hypothetical protein